ncbi:MAG: triose-phosphate isomerase [Candidatus Sphingomonas colombiensis]|nr:triose-phosphate isomerase [Sphingomonas sp.]WEK42331.1 MAG: triose-phosphate isomerase [Sphingomonas sp.]
MRRKLVAGNWKMNGSLASLAELDGIGAAVDPRVDVAIALPATLIGPAAARASFPIGAEDVHSADSGAHTGCISALMAKEAGATFSIVGHSERRQGQCESDADVKAKAEALRRNEMDAILCVGETLDERESGRAVAVVTAQVRASLPEGASGEWLAIAYEPIWAIGTGRTATVADVEAMHGAIRATLVEMLGAEGGAGVRLLYGGSVTAENAAALFHASDVDGALVGGASLTAAKFAPIIAAGAGA